MKKSLILSLALLFSFAAHAAGAVSGTVALMEKVPGALLVTLSGTVSGTRPACATITTRFAINTTTIDGQTDAAQIRFASALGRTVSFAGTYTCSVWSDTETAATITVNP